MREKIRFTLKPGECRVVAGRRFCNRWRPRTASAHEEYRRGIEDPRRPYGKTTCEAAGRYKAGTDAAHTKGLFVKGVKKAGTEKWQDKALTKGPGRFIEGIHGAGDEFAAGYEPYRTGYIGISLPKRWPNGDPRNIDRCKAVCTTFGRLKEGQEPTDKIVCPVK